MVTSSIDEAQSQLVQLIGLTEKGEEIVIAREGKPRKEDWGKEDAR